MASRLPIEEGIEGHHVFDFDGMNAKPVAMAWTESSLT